ncbi:MAG: hypothetical protein H7Z14_10005, partial [Anaerolineae bacterium]|nr:hypothetical protein [Phycisphaerae bacterium]
DPIEDNPRHSGHDYRTNWESTLIASLLQPEVWHYEIMPWPHRIFEKSYPSTQPVKKDTPRIPMPKEYETELQAVITAMGDMKQPPEKVQWLSSGTRDVGVLVSDTMMFQRFGPDSSDGELGSFYGLALPLLMRGIPVEAVQIETADLAPYKVLLLTYEGQKPPNQKLHAALAKWVNDGGALIVIDDDKDPFHKVREWWNTGEYKLDTPRHDLFDVLKVPRDATGLTRVGKGAVVYADKSPAAISHARDGGDQVRTLTKSAMSAIGVEWKEANSLVLRRGPYIVAGGLDDPKADAAPVALRGRFIPLFDAALPVVSEYVVKPGTRALLVDLDAMPEVGVVAAACRVSDTHVSSDKIEFTTDGIDQTNGLICIKVPSAPKSVTIESSAVASDAYEYRDGLLRIRLNNQPDARRVTISW